MEHLTNEDIEELVWEFVSEHLEKIENLPILLEDIHYVSDLEPLINQIDFLEDFDSEIEIDNINKSDNGIVVSFNINALLSAWCEQEQVLRITVSAAGACIIKPSKIVEIIEIQYDNVECDDIRAV